MQDSPLTEPKETAYPKEIYAGFWIRFLAFMIDIIIWSFITAPLLIWAYGSEYFTGEEIDPNADFSTVLATSLQTAGSFDFFINYIAPAVVIIWFWNRFVATPGKMAVNIVIVDAQTLYKPELNQLIGRYFGQVLSFLVLGLGFIMIAFQDRKQGLHDLLAGTVVVKKQYLDMDKVMEPAESPGSSTTP